VDSQVVRHVVTAAAAAASAGDLEQLTSLIAAAAVKAAADVDLIVLAQYSLAPALSGVAAAVDVPVLSPPHLAAASLARRLGRAGAR